MFDAVIAESVAATPDEAPAARRRIVDLHNRPRSDPRSEAPVKPAAKVGPARRLDIAEHGAAIVAAIEAMRPRLQRDGGDCEFVDIVDNVIRVKLSGACVGCQLSSMTMVGVRMKLTEALGFLVKAAPV